MKFVSKYNDFHEENFWKCLLQNVCHFASGAYKKHLLTHEEHSIWKCDQCSYTCELRSGYAAVHMARAHNINRHEVRKKYRRHKQVISLMSQKRHSISCHRQLGCLFKQGRTGISYMYRNPWFMLTSKNSKAPCSWPFVQSTCDWWIPLKKG